MGKNTFFGVFGTGTRFKEYGSETFAFRHSTIFVVDNEMTCRG
jgi:hypothetical protein